MEQTPFYLRFQARLVLRYACTLAQQVLEG